VSMKDRFAVDIVEFDRAQLASSPPENRLRSHQSSGSIIYICIDLQRMACECGSPGKFEMDAAEPTCSTSTPLW
jgi:hypothetical protein